MPLATTHTPHEPAAAGGLLLRLRAWFAAVRPVGAPFGTVGGDAAQCVPRASSAGRSLLAVGEPHRLAVAATLLRFPIRGEALLVRLAEILRKRVASAEPRPNPFVLTLRRAARSQLLIDHASYIEFYPERSAFHVVLEATADTTITLDTTDFDTLVRFVVLYVNDRLSEFSDLEAAS